MSSTPPTETSRPAPLLPGFYHVQTLSSDEKAIGFTQYHRTAAAAVIAKDLLAKKGKHDGFVICSSESRWDIYGRKGKLVKTVGKITPESGVLLEQHEQVSVDKEVYLNSAKEILGFDALCLTFCEHHALASSVGHSNMVVIARQLVLEASDDDLRHIYLVDSVVENCRVQGWFMDPKSVSMTTMDRYLDRHKWLSRGWPLANDHHLQVLSWRIATLRPMYLMHMLMTVADAASLGEHKAAATMRAQSLTAHQSIELTAKILDGMESAVRIAGEQSTEKIDEEALAQNAPRIAEIYRTMFS